MELIRDMDADDEIAFVRYADDAEVIQSLARVGTVRETLMGRVRGLTAGGGTAIPRGLSRGLSALASTHGERIRRVVLVSDGLDSTRAEAERLASDSFERGITISSMGIGLRLPTLSTMPPQSSTERSSPRSVMALTHAYTAVDAARAAHVGIDDAALESVETVGESLDAVSRAIIDIG